MIVTLGQWRERSAEQLLGRGRLGAWCRRAWGIQLQKQLFSALLLKEGWCPGAVWPWEAPQPRRLAAAWHPRAHTHTHTHAWLGTGCPRFGRCGPSLHTAPLPTTHTALSSRSRRPSRAFHSLCPTHGSLSPLSFSVSWDEHKGE